MAGGKVSSSQFAAFLIDGYSLLAAKITGGVTHTIKSILEKSTGLGDAWDAMLPTGLQQATIVQSGAFFDDSVNGMHLALGQAGQQATSRLVMAAFAGNTFGAEFVGIQGTYGMAYDVLGAVGLLTKANVSYQISGQVDRGMIVQTWTQKTITWNTKTDGNSIDFTLDRSQRVIPITSNTQANPTVITTPVPHGLTSADIILISGNSGSNVAINGQQTVTVLTPTTFSIPVNDTTAGGTGGSFIRANTSNGGVGYQAVSEMTGPTGFIGKVRDSADDTTYGDLLTFTNVTAAPAAERLTNVADTVVDRYLCFTGTVTGAGTLTVFCGFARS
jgi:hypothetical protein